MKRIPTFLVLLGVLLLPLRLRADSIFTAFLTGVQESPPTASPATGFATVVLNAAQDMITVDLIWTGLTAPASAAHIHCCAPPGVSAGVLFPFSGVPAATSSQFTPEQTFVITPLEVSELEAGLMYINIHDSSFPSGEIRGQILPAATPESASLALLAFGLLFVMLYAAKTRGLNT